MDDRWGLGFGAWVAVGGGVVLAVSLLVLPWFQLTVDGFSQPDTGGEALELLDGLDVVLIIAALVPIVAPALAPGERASRLVAVAGAVALMVTLYTIVAPPEPDPLLGAMLESSAELGFEPRIGAFIGLVASLAIVAGGALEMTRQEAAPVVESPAQPVQPPPEPAPVAAKPLAAVEPEPTPARKRQPKPTTKPVAKTKGAPKASSLPKAGSKVKAAPKAKAKSRSASKAKPAKKAKQGPAPKAKPASAKLSLATATADELVGIGFTANQAERIVSYRDEEALVSSVADLARVPGISKPVLEKLVKRLDD